MLRMRSWVYSSVRPDRAPTSVRSARVCSSSPRAMPIWMRHPEQVPPVERGRVEHQRPVDQVERLVPAAQGSERLGPVVGDEDALVPVAAVFAGELLGLDGQRDGLLERPRFSSASTLLASARSTTRPLFRRVPIAWARALTASAASRSSLIEWPSDRFIRSSASRHSSPISRAMRSASVGERGALDDLVGHDQQGAEAGQHQRPGLAGQRHQPLGPSEVARWRRRGPVASCSSPSGPAVRRPAPGRSRRRARPARPSRI